MPTPKYYRRVSMSALQDLAAFRASHEYRTALVRGTEWRYLLAGEGETILLLPGASCIAEVGWRTIQGLEKGFRVLSPDFPALGNPDLAAGILGVLDREGIRKVHVMGGSAGGLVAQYLVRHYPDLAPSLILSHTVVPKRETGMLLARVLVALRRLPDWVARRFLTAQMRRLVPFSRHPAVTLFWAQFREAVWSRITKAQIISMIERSAELAATQELGPADPELWKGRVLLILSEDDPLTPEATRQRIQALYPRATVRRFHGTGHLTSTRDPVRFVAAVEEFLRSPGG